MQIPLWKLNTDRTPCPSPLLLKLTDISQVDKAVLADVGAGAGLWLHNGAGVRLFIANDPQLRRLHTARQVYVKNCAQFL